MKLGPAVIAVASTASPLLMGEPADSSGFDSVYAKDRFASLVNSTFSVRSADEVNTWLTLLSVDDRTAPVSSLQAVQTQCFRLRFQGIGRPLPEATHSLEHPALGTFALFITPTNESGYIAVINRIVGPWSFPPPARIRRSVAVTVGRE